MKLPNLQRSQVKSEENMLKSVDPSPTKKSKGLILSVFIVVIAGLVTGWLLSGREGVGLRLGSGSGTSSPASQGGNKNEAGVDDVSKFGAPVEGMLKEGGINGEGAYHLERDGGPSQYVYLISTSVDLAGFVDKKVQIWGETISAEKAGWLMDVVKIKVSK